MTRRTLLLLLILLAGCQRAAPYGPAPAKEGPRPGPDAKAKEDLDEGIHWANLGREPDKGQTPIVFVHWSKPEEWAKLKGYWNEEAKGPVRIRVPLGLDDPSSNIPEFFTLVDGRWEKRTTLTRERWELGRRLFFDATILGTGQSCASCHKPSEAFADPGKKASGSFNTPSLVNSVFLRSLFWDGRATHLEEAMQATLEDERRPALPFRHSWPGVIGRLRASKAYKDAFHKAFGEDMPNQDIAGQALAGYMRTLLAGDSLHDRAERAAKGAVPAAAHYLAVLDDKALASLGKSGVPKAIVAETLSKGHGLFHGRALCSRCHRGGYYSDHGFHNIDVDAARLDAEKANRGRFNVAPLGEKSRWSMGAWKTPTLRGLRRTAPYFHNGQAGKLLEAVRHHARKRGTDETLNIFLSPILSDKNGNFLDLGLRDEDIEAITLFLHALDGTEVDASVSTPPK